MGHRIVPAEKRSVELQLYLCASQQHDMRRVVHTVISAFTSTSSLHKPPLVSVKGKRKKPETGSF